MAWVGSLAVAIVLFTAMGSGSLAAPPVTDPGAWSDWLAARDAAVATVAILRLVVLALAWYLVGATTIGAIARVARWTAMVRVADALSVPAVRRVLQASLGVGLATSVVVSATGVPVPDRGGPTVAAAAAQTAVAPPSMQPVDSPRMRPVAPDDRVQPARDTAGDLTVPHGAAPGPESPQVAPPEATTSGPASSTAPPTTVDADDAATDLVTIEEGDHLWAVAERRVTAAAGGAVDDATVAAYWRRLVDANRGRLVDPDDPDLVLPGQRFVLPPLEADR